MIPDVEFRPSAVPFEAYPETDERAQAEALKGSRQLKGYAQYRERVKDHPHNPSYHFYAPNGMINDPNGLCFWRGRWHLFYQAYPPEDARPHWGHICSEDLAHWRDLPLAIYPDREYAAFSGSTLAEEDRVIAMYHGRWIGNMIATSSDPLLLNWKKSAANPVVPMLPDEDEREGRPYSVFDPFLWKDETGYYALSGTLYGVPEDRGKNERNRMVEQLFHSQDLERWAYLGELAPGGFPQVPLGNDGACPYFLPLGERHVLFFFSHETGPYALTGDLDPLTHRFTPDRLHKFNFGPVGCSSYQAPCAAPDGNGGVYLIFNTKDANPDLERKGAMSVVAHVTLGSDGKLRMRPVEAMSSLHGARFEARDVALASFEEKTLDVRGRALDICMKIRRGGARAVRVEVLKSADGREHTDVVLHMPARRRPGVGYVTVDTSRSSLGDGMMSRIPESTAFDWDEGEELDVRILLDRCMLEVFVNERVVLMQMMYPVLPDSEHVSVTAIGGDAQLASAQIWQMNGIYGPR